ncbi:MAG: hypothetical protein WAJ85_08390 [Candidatus Baltobacteraceae bacterium]|jgi:hypothetical protein
MNERTGHELLIRNSRQDSWIAVVPAREFVRLPVDERRAHGVAPASAPECAERREGFDWIGTLLLLWCGLVFWAMWYFITRG